MSKRIRIFLLILASPFLFVVAINEIPQVPDRSHKYKAENCTWYCHDITCRHWKDSYKDNPTRLKKMHKDIFAWIVRNLHENPGDVSYREINILVYIMGYPIICGLLVWNLVRKIK